MISCVEPNTSDECRFRFQGIDKKSYFSSAMRLTSRTLFFPPFSITRTCTHILFPSSLPIRSTVLNNAHFLPGLIPFRDIYDTKAINHFESQMTKYVLMPHKPRFLPWNSSSSSTSSKEPGFARVDPSFHFSTFVQDAYQPSFDTLFFWVSELPTPTTTTYFDNNDGNRHFRFSTQRSGFCVFGWTWYIHMSGDVCNVCKGTFPWQNSEFIMFSPRLSDNIGESGTERIVHAISWCI